MNLWSELIEARICDVCFIPLRHSTKIESIRPLQEYEKVNVDHVVVHFRWAEPLEEWP